MPTVTKETLIEALRTIVVIMGTLCAWSFLFGGKTERWDALPAKVDYMMVAVESANANIAKTREEVAYIRGMIERRVSGLTDEEATLASAIIELLPSLPHEFDLHDVARELATRHPDATATLSAISMTLSRLREAGELEVTSKFTRPYKYRLARQ